MHHVIKKVKEFVFPLHCLICDNINQDLLRNSCTQKINFITKPYCECCGYKLVGDYEASNDMCANCLRNPPLFSTATSVMSHNDNSKNIICKFKFSDAIYATQFYSKRLINSSKHILPVINTIIPVPLHRLRLLSRGYNQSSLLANSISKYTNINVDHLSLSRVKNTSLQSRSSTVTKRIANMKNVFAVKNENNIRNKNILLIDDVISTGATIFSCTDVLLKSGAKSVHVLTIARTERPLLRIL